HCLWQAGIVVLLLAACLRFINTSHVRYVAACVALLFIVAASIGTFLYVVPKPLDRAQPQTMLDPRLGRPVSDTTNSLTAQSSRFVLQKALPWITPVWVLGVLLFNFKEVASWAAVRRMRRRGTCSVADAWQQKLSEIQARMKVSRAVALLESCMTHVP